MTKIVGRNQIAVTRVCYWVAVFEPLVGDVSPGTLQLPGETASTVPAWTAEPSDGEMTGGETISGTMFAAVTTPATLAVEKTVSKPLEDAPTRTDNCAPRSAVVELYELSFAP